MSGTGTSAVGGSVSRAEVLQRAQFWVDQGVTYTQTGPWAPDSGGKTYRRDCSGLVSMAWHLTTSRVTANFLGKGDATLASLHDLRAGDAMLHVNHHIELFTSWIDEDHHDKGCFVYSFNATGRSVRNPHLPSNFGNKGIDDWSEMKTYVPIRYGNITEQAAAPFRPPDGSFVRDQKGRVYLVVGGAPFHLSRSEWGAFGQPGTIDAPPGGLAGMSPTIHGGTLIRSPGLDIFLVVGNAKYHVTRDEWIALGQPKAIDVPARLTATLGTVPQDGSLLRNPADLSIWLVVGGAKYKVTPDEYEALHRPAFVNVPADFLHAVQGTLPDGTFYLRDPVNGAVFQVVGGAGFHLNAEEYMQLHEPATIAAPAGFLAKLHKVPADGSFIRDFTDGRIFVMEQGRKRHLSPEQWAALLPEEPDEADGLDSTNLPDRWLDLIPDAS